MGYPVLLLSRSGIEGWWGKTCLAKPRFEVCSVTTHEEAFQALESKPFELCVVESPPSDSGLKSFLAHLRSTGPLQALKCVIVTRSEDPELEGPPVSAVLRPPFTPQQFDNIAARLLDISSRGTMRHLVRPFHASEGISGKALGIGTTRLMTSNGILVESSNSLPLHKDLVWAFSGVPKLRWLVLPGTISKVEAGAKGTGLRRYHVDLDTTPTPARRKFLNYLEESE